MSDESRLIPRLQGCEVLELSFNIFFGADPQKGGWAPCVYASKFRGLTLADLSLHKRCDSLASSLK